MKRTNHL